MGAAAGKHSLDRLLSFMFCVGISTPMLLLQHHRLVGCCSTAAGLLYMQLLYAAKTPTSTRGCRDCKLEAMLQAS